MSRGNYIKVDTLFDSVFTKARQMSRETGESYDSCLCLIAGDWPDERPTEVVTNEPKEPVVKMHYGSAIACKTDGTCEIQENRHLAVKCPNCDWFVGELYDPKGNTELCYHFQMMNNYCSRCGQKLDWSNLVRNEHDERRRLYKERQKRYEARYKTTFEDIFADEEEPNEDNRVE